MKSRNSAAGALVLSSFARRAWAATWVVCLVSVSGCVSVRITGADNVEDLQAEDRYKATYAEQMTEFHADNQLFAPIGSNPGVCNAGGSKQGCYEADATVIQHLQAMLRALVATPVPPRFTDGDKLLRKAIAEDIRGLQLRNQAIAENDDAAWKEHEVALGNAVAIFQEAYQAYPQDNRPQPPP